MKRVKQTGLRCFQGSVRLVLGSPDDLEIRAELGVTNYFRCVATRAWLQGSRHGGRRAIRLLQWRSAPPAQAQEVFNMELLCDASEVARSVIDLVASCSYSSKARSP